MNVFSFLDAHSLASFSETARRPNFECFYFLELQLQRALLIGESHHFMDDLDGDRMDDANLLQNNELRDEDESNAENGTYSNNAMNRSSNRNRSNTIPSFEGSIAPGILPSSSTTRTFSTVITTTSTQHPRKHGQERT